MNPMGWRRWRNLFGSSNLLPYSKQWLEETRRRCRRRRCRNGGGRDWLLWLGVVTSRMAGWYCITRNVIRDDMIWCKINAQTKKTGFNEFSGLTDSTPSTRKISPSRQSIHFARNISRAIYRTINRHSLSSYLSEKHWLFADGINVPAALSNN